MTTILQRLLGSCQTPAERDKESARASRCRRILPVKVCNTDVRVTSQDPTTQMRPQKRLQLGHKVPLLVTIFERDTPSLEVSVSRRDPVRLKDLMKLMTGSVETAMVKRQLGRMA